MLDIDVIVVGAGPVGMVAALLAANEGLEVLLLEKSDNRHVQSRAIGITPPSLEILQHIGLTDLLLDKGISVRFVRIHDETRLLCSLDFSQLPDKFPFVLAIPQHRTETLLEEAIARVPSIHLLRGHTVEDVFIQGEQVEVYGGHSQGGRFHFICRCLLGCDGGRSITREALEIPFDGASDSQTFLMGDFEDNGTSGDDACFFLRHAGRWNHFPYPEGSAVMF